MAVRYEGAGPPSNGTDRCGRSAPASREDGDPPHVVRRILLSMTTSTSTLPREANLFDLRGHGTHVTYSTTSLAGRPTLTFEQHGKSQSFHGEAIRVQETEIGRLVTVTLEAVPDLHVVTLSLLLPPVNVEGTEASVETESIRTTARTSIAGPRLVKGQVSSYESVKLHGTAKAVDF
mgnify:CR=1 FL=1